MAGSTAVWIRTALGGDAARGDGALREEHGPAVVDLSQIESLRAV